MEIGDIMNVYFAVDIGGTNIKIGLFKEDDTLITNVSIKTNPQSTPENVFNDIKQTTQQILRKENIDVSKVKGYGIGLPGPIKNNVVVRCPNLGWGKTNITKIFKKAFNEQVEVAASNDALLAAYGEYKKLNSNEDIVFITLGTGVGGGIIINGKILEGAHGAAGEVGHIQVEYNSPRLCTCGLYGCLETVASIRGFKEVGTNLLKNHRGPTRLTRTTMNPPNIFYSAAKQDKLALKIIAEISNYIAIATAKIVLVIDPDKVIIGGGISRAGDYFIKEIEKAYKKYSHYGTSKIKIEQAKLSGDAGIFGAYYLIKDKIENKVNL